MSVSRDVNYGDLDLTKPADVERLKARTSRAAVIATVNIPRGPVVRVFVVGSDNTVFAIDAATGKIAWQKANPHPLKGPKQGDYRCPSSQNTTPVIDKDVGLIYVSTNDGKLRGFSLLDGAD